MVFMVYCLKVIFFPSFKHKNERMVFIIKNSGVVLWVKCLVRTLKDRFLLVFRTNVLEFGSISSISETKHRVFPFGSDILKGTLVGKRKVSKDQSRDRMIWLSQHRRKGLW
jgi:hypothetical protein